MVVTGFVLWTGRKDSNGEGPACNVENLNRDFLYDELDLLVRQLLFQLVKAHQLIKVISHLEPQLLNINGRLILVRRTRPDPHT